MRKKAVEVLANLKNIVILDCDKEALYKQVASDTGRLLTCYFPSRGGTFPRSCDLRQNKNHF